uniref:Uncharacterized protein n=1 Tax=viral metagenome TaxID=1070528 RepID=A0A6M3IGD2_9ZZZZ
MKKERVMDENRAQPASTTVSGVDFGDYEWRRFLPLAFGGHCYYVRQDVTGEKSEHGHHLGGIVLPDTVVDRSRFVTVLGIGPRVGLKASRAHRHEFQWSSGSAVVSGVKIGDRLLLGFEKGETGLLTNKIHRSPLNWDCELFIEETLPDAVVME